MKHMFIKKAAGYIDEHLIIMIYAVLSLSLELLSLIYFDCFPYIEQPVFPLLLWFFFIVTLFIFNSKRLKAIYSFFYLLVQGILIIACNYLYLSNGTVFEKSMIYQRNDAYATIEEFYFSPVLLITYLIGLIGYLAFLIIYLKKSHNNYHSNKKHYNRKCFVVLAGVIAGIFLFLFAKFTSSASENPYEAKLYETVNSYQKLGVSGNCVFELLRRDKSDNVDLSDIDQLESTLYSSRCDISKYNEISKGNNLIMILAESFEWYPMKQYPKDITEKVYPNLSRLMREGIICDNFYAREKTDTSEALMLVGSNPTGKYIHNNFADNSYPFSLPNMIRRQTRADGEDDYTIRSFHQNKGSFYNRETAHKSFGFDELVDINKMELFGLENTWNMKQRERTLDSLTVNAMKDEMFPADHGFFSFWISFSTHGFYNNRINLKEYYNTFDELRIFPEGDKYENYLRTYAATVADFDKALGIILNDLDKKKILDNTTIAIISDHNTYYNGLSGYVKNINTPYNPELYKVPMILYDQKLAAAMDTAGDSRSISKFTTTADVIPTILDLFGIPGWQELYFGSTIFNPDKESIIYSRAYNIFITDQYICYSLNNVKYKAPDITKDDVKDFEKRSLIHLNRLRRLDMIYYSDYFSDHPYKP